QAVRRASEYQLLEQSAPRLESLQREGVTVVEIKSGYGLTLEDEARMLRVARQLGRELGVTVRTTLLAAHALPPEFARPDDYVKTISKEWLPTLHGEGLAVAEDVFCETVAFDTTHAAKLFDAASALGLPVKAHSEQLANTGASKLAAQYRALSS